MRLSTLLLCLSLGAIAEANIAWLPNRLQVLLGATEKVPGASSIVYCDNEFKSDILQLKYINLSPNPPIRGENFTVSAAGSLSQEIEKLAYVRVQVRYGYMPIYSGIEDLCEETATVDEPCPIGKGNKTIGKEFELPKNIPAGKYVVRAEAFTKDDERITCLTSEVQL